MGAFLSNLISVCAGMVVIVGAGKILSKWKYGRKLWERNISDPLSEWASRTIREGAQAFHDEAVKPVLDRLECDLTYVKKEVTTNDGSSVKDAIRRVENRVEDIAQRQGLPPAGLDPTERQSSL